MIYLFEYLFEIDLKMVCELRAATVLAMTQLSQCSERPLYEWNLVLHQKNALGNSMLSKKNPFNECFTHVDNMEEKAGLVVHNTIFF